MNRIVVKSVREGFIGERRGLLIHAVAASCCLVLATFAVWHTHGATPDDALITYRYAQNLLDGHGWVYNLHRHTSDAATAPLYTVLLAGVGLLVGGVKYAGPILFVLTTAASAHLSFALLRRFDLTYGGATAAVLMILNPWLLVTRGMETSLFVCLLLLTSLLLADRRHAPAGFTLAAATLVRGDGAVVALVAAVFVAVELRAFPKRLALGALAAAVPWTIFAFAVIGSPFPDTLAAKAAQGRSGYWGTGDVYIKGLTEMPSVFGFDGWFKVIVVLGAPGLVATLWIRGLRRALAPYLIGALVVFAVYGLAIKTPAYHWYYGMQVALLTLGAGVTIGVVSRAVIGFWSERPAIARPAVRAITLGTALAAATSAAVGAEGWERTVQNFGPEHYVHAAAFLRSHTPEGSSIAATEIGILGWQIGNRDMVDYVGLLSKESAHEIAHRDVTTWLAREEPDYWVVHEPMWELETAADQPWFPLAYEQIYRKKPIAIWKKVRPIAEAKAIEAQRIEPVIATLAGQLGVPDSDPGDRAALASLLAVYTTRPDLQRAYTHGGQLDLRGLLEWAGSDRPWNGEGGAALEWLSQNYRNLAKRATAASYSLPDEWRGWCAGPGLGTGCG
ncbi:MAG: hypothetical protein HOV83_16515 [Catenulispora sp.]|nr:hypothetical protein [Catenulispora sp.]